jgi:uncharacterized protein
MRDRFGQEGDGGQPAVLTIPGLNNSGPDHWQTLWERRRGDCSRVNLGDWDNPRRELWVNRLDAAIRDCGGPIVLVGHSLGCIAIAWWATLCHQPYGWPVAGALLVAPADCDQADRVSAVGAFGPLPRTPLPFPSIVVASRDDPYMRYERAHSFGKYWGSQVVDAGECGHINSASGLGEWAFGQRLLDRLLAGATDQAALFRQFRPAHFNTHGAPTHAAPFMPG